MSQSPKRLLPEVPVIPSLEPRARVSSRLRHLLTVGATSASLACWPLACDPMPPPVDCHTNGSVLKWLEVFLSSPGTLPVKVTIKVKTYGGEGDTVNLTRTSLTGGTAGAAVRPFYPTVIEDTVDPSSPSAVIELTYSTLCAGKAAKPIRLTLTPRSLGPPDAGAVDGGSSDAGTTDAGTSDAGTSDAGTSDAGATDAGTSDAGEADAGTSTEGYYISLTEF